MKKVITISREFGSGGRTVGKLVAEKMGYKYYDKEIIEKVAEETGFSKAYISQRGEHSPTASMFSYSFMGRAQDGLSTDDYLFSVQRKIILKLAEEGNCVIVGRCADYVLREHPGLLSLFVTASEEDRLGRLMKCCDKGEKECRNMIATSERKRASYYNYYSFKAWGAAESYDLTLNSSVFGIEGCADMVVAALEKKLNQKL